MQTDYQNSNWYLYMEPQMRALVDESFKLLEHTKSDRGVEVGFKDFGFVVFPMAKAFEGFLKRVFLDMNLITGQQYYGEHFRIGRALNPNLPKRYRSGWVFEKLVSACNGDHLPLVLWETWKRGRNKVFHYFPNKEAIITLAEAEESVVKMADAMEKTVSGCGLK